MLVTRTARASYGIRIFAILLLVEQHCANESYGPRVIRLSDRALSELRIGTTAAEIQRQLGRPSLIWRADFFGRQNYPHDSSCAATHPLAMWVYYDLTNGSVCLYFDARDRLLCYERNPIVIAQ